MSQKKPLPDKDAKRKFLDSLLQRLDLGGDDAIQITHQIELGKV